MSDCVCVCVCVLCVRFQYFQLTTQEPNTTEMNPIYIDIALYKVIIRSSHLPGVLVIKMKMSHVQTPELELSAKVCAPSR